MYIWFSIWYYFSSVQRASFSIYLNADLLVTNILSFCFSKDVLISPLSLKNIFARYKILGWWTIFFILVLRSSHYLLHAAKSIQSCLTLCNPLVCNPPDSSVQGTFQARILEWVVMPSSRWSSQPRDQTSIS